MGQLTYSFETNKNINFNVQFTVSHQHIQNVELICKSGVTTLNIQVIDICAEDEDSTLKNIILNFVSMLTIKLDIPTGKLRLCGYNLPYKSKDKKGLSRVVKDFQLVASFINNEKTINYDDIERLFSTDVKEHNILINHQLSVALSEEEPVTKFILLYNVLQQSAGDKQNQVDKLIRKARPNVQEFVRTLENGKEIKETIYSKLRNELNHKRKGNKPNLEKTKNTVIVYSDKFTKLVTKIILENN